jgi:dipeptidyl aminopeptidase/acylaminoacyl peptidase
MADRINKEGDGDGGRTVELKIYEGEGHVFAKGTTLEDMEVRRERWFRRWLVGDGE